MKILIFTGYLDKILNANNKIACETADLLAEKGHRVTVCGLSTFMDETEFLANGVKKIYYQGRDFTTQSKNRLEKYIAGSDKSRQQLVKEFSFRHPLAAVSIFLSYTKYFNDRKIVSGAAEIIEKLHKEEKFDVVIGYHMPFWSAKAISVANLPECKKVIYQLDPWGLLEIASLSTDPDEKRIADELECFGNVDWVFTTAPLYNQYTNHVSYAAVSGRISPLEFPIVKEASVTADSPITFDKDYINITFAGMLDDNFRNPKLILETVEKLILCNDKIKLHFIGTNISRTLNSYLEKYPDNIFHYKPVPPQQAFAALADSDFLLNISNNISNMVPSKIFDYFSMGKPIVNIQKIPNCPARKYMDSYPLCFNMKEFENTDYSGALMEFLSSGKGRQIPFEQIKEIYRTATPDYVADKIIEIISNL